MNAPHSPLTARLEARIDLDALRANVRRLLEIAAPSQVMAVVKADAYGHGMIPCARAALEAGATWIGTAVPEEALALRAAGIEAPILTWLHSPGDDFEALVRAGVDISVSGQWALHAVLEAVEATGVPARIQLKADTGLGRNGAQPLDWPLVVDEAVKAERDGLLRVTGIWSHFACADEPGHPSIQRQLTAFHEALAYAAEAAGVRPEVRHMANSPATLSIPESRFDLVRTGVAMYGLSPAPELGLPADHGLRPVMSLVARLASVKRVPTGHGVSYAAPQRTTIQTRRPGSRWSRPATRTGSPAPPPASARSRSADTATRSPGASPWTSSWSTSAPAGVRNRIRTSARRRCSSAPATTGVPPPRTGRRR